MKLHCLSFALVLVAATACPNADPVDLPTIQDASKKDGSIPDADLEDAGPDSGKVDGGDSDSGSGDAGAMTVDTGVLDSGPLDAASGTDAGPGDATPSDGAMDAATLDAEPADAGLDAGSADAGLDAGTMDVGPVDGGPPVNPCRRPALPNCTWLEVNTCNAGLVLNTFCPAGQTIGRMCNCGGGLYTPNASYQLFPVSFCPTPDCPIDPTHVVWRDIECCVP